jgi:hypothetical protein
MTEPPEFLSPKRSLLCSRDNAQRVAAQIFADRGEPVSILRTGDPLQPYRVLAGAKFDDTVEMVLVS